MPREIVSYDEVTQLRSNGVGERKNARLRLVAKPKFAPYFATSRMICRASLYAIFSVLARTSI